MNRSQVVSPQSFPPMEFWRIYFRNSYSSRWEGKIPCGSKALMFLDQVFGNLSQNCIASIKEKEINIEYHRCRYVELKTDCSPTCKAHLGAIAGVFEKVNNKKLEIIRVGKKDVCVIQID